MTSWPADEDTLSALLARNVARAPNAAAATDERGTLTWRALEERAVGFAAVLARHGVTAGGRVALWLPNSVDYLALIFACARLGATAVHVNTRFRTAEVGTLLRRSQARVLITAWGFAPVDFAAIFRAIDSADRSGIDVILGRDAPAHDLEGCPVVSLAGAGAICDAATPDAPCLTFTTSGTTRGPKLVWHTQRSIVSHARDVTRALRTDQPGACILCAVPLCGTFGNALAMNGVAGGAHLVLMAQFEGAAAAALIRAHRITHLGGADDMLGRIAAAARAPFETLVFSGFARFTPMASANIAAAQAANMQPVGLYGSSEMQALFSRASDAQPLVDGGVPVSPATQIAIRDPDTGAPVAAGDDGELCLKAPSAFAGYLDDPDATARAFTQDGFFRTGDLACMQGAGFVFKSRIGDTLRLGGFLVNPEEIESFLQTLPDIVDAQVVAVERGGERVPVAFVRARLGQATNEEAVLVACRTALARYKQPVRAIFLDEFPVTEGPNGVKIQRAKLREMATDALDRTR